MHRGLTPITLMYYRIAQEHHLSCPLGRALAMTNRHYNRGYHALALQWPGVQRVRLHALREMTPARAQRWLTHWRAGGSLRSLGYSRKEWLGKRATERLRNLMTEMEANRRNLERMLTCVEGSRGMPLERMIQFYRLRGDA